MLNTLLHLFGDCDDADRQARDLAAMNDRQLADLGISRDQISAFVRHRAGC